MATEHWARLKAAFHQALELPPAERDTFLRNACGDDSGLLAELRALVAAHEGAGSFLEAGPAATPTVAAALHAAVEGLRIGPYRVVEELGRGGMGAVYRAERETGEPGGFRQSVAIKLLKRGMDTDEIVRRFVTERQILAQLNHPNIARLLDGGTTADGRPYLVMERVEGEPLTHYAARRALSVEARLRLFTDVCQAVRFAHQNLVVHRDLKPANILVDATGTPKLLDFGIAKLLAADAGEGALTVGGQRPMTPGYASPEQILGGVITTATDVYGLGLVLYELLTEQQAFALGPGGAATGELTQRALAGELRRPSQALRRGGADPTEVRRLARRLAGDLDAIVLRCLEVDSSRRYGGAAELLADLERHLAGLPVAAREPSWPERAGRWVRRHRLASAFAGSVVLFSLAMTYQTVALGRERTRVAAERDLARGLVGFLRGLFQVADPEGGQGASVTARELLDAGANQLLQEPSRGARGFGDRVETRASLLATIGEVYQGLGLYDSAAAALGGALSLQREGLLTVAKGERRASELALSRTLVQLAHLHRRRGALADSLGMATEARELRERHLGPNAPELAEVWNALGLTRDAQGDAEAGAQALDRAIALARQGGAGHRLALAEALGNRASLEIGRARPEAALGPLEEARAIHREALGAEDPRLATDLATIGALLYNRGDFQAARKPYEEAADLQRRRLGEAHPDLAVSLLGLAAVTLKLGDTAASEAAAREALRIQRQVLPAGHRDLANTLGTLASVLRERGRVDDAEAAYREGLEIQRAVFGAESAEVANTLNSLSLVVRDRGDLAAARDLAAQALALRERHLGPRDPAVAGSLNTLAGIHQRMGNLALAEDLYRRSLGIRRERLPAGHADIALSLVGLGNLLLERHQPAAALPLLEEALALRQQALPAGHWGLGTVQGALGECFTALGRFDEAAPLLSASVEILRAARGPEHDETLRAERRLAALAVARAAPGAP